MDSITVRSFAKINWMLRILGRRPDGFHDVQTVFQTISLHDVLGFRRSDTMEISCDDPAIPADETNLAVGAANMMRDAFGIDPVRIDLRKVIPAGGGLGGGSSNAAMTLLALDRMFELGTPTARLLDMAAELGSDVPFFLVAGTAWATGRGERLSVLPSPPPLPLLVLIPDERVPTAEAYNRLARAREAGELRVPFPYGFDRAEWVMREGVADRGAELVNDFEAVIFGMMPHLRVLKEALLEAGACVALLSGSGSALFGAFRNRATRDAATPQFGNGVRAIPCDPITAREAMRDLR
ncbi:MAG: 4-(cytidine 5'-diphospho)-2-C-methyl-D-erythritol kinase [Thermoanaerobaculia bacterium]